MIDPAAVAIPLRRASPARGLGAGGLSDSNVPHTEEANRDNPQVGPVTTGEVDGWLKC